MKEVIQQQAEQIARLKKKNRKLKARLKFLIQESHNMHMNWNEVRVALDQIENKIK